MIHKIKPNKEDLKMDIQRDLYPQFGIELKHLPEAKEWEVGKTYQLGLKVKMVSRNIEGNRDSARFDILEIEAIKKIFKSR